MTYHDIVPGVIRVSELAVAFQVSGATVMDNVCNNKDGQESFPAWLGRKELQYVDGLSEFCLLQIDSAFLS